MSRTAVDFAARAIRHGGLPWVKSSALLTACLVALSPEPGAADPDQALLRCVARHGQAALEACDEAVASDLGRAQRGAAHYHRGLELMSLGRDEDAARAFAEAARLTSGVPAVHTSLGVALAHLHRWHEAVEAYRHALRVDFNDADAHYNLGVALGHLGGWAEAITEFRTAARLNPVDAEARYNLGLAFNAVGRQEEAIAAYGEAVRVSPGYATAWGNLGMTAFLLGRDGEAAAAFARAEAMQPGYFETRDVQRGAWETARRRLEGAPGSPSAESASVRSSLAPPRAGPHTEATAPKLSRQRTRVP